MGKAWGNLYYVKNVVYHRISPYELNPFANFWKKSIQGIKRDFNENGLFLIGLASATYFTIAWAEEEYRKTTLKQPGQFDHEK